MLYATILMGVTLCGQQPRNEIADTMPARPAPAPTYRATRATRTARYRAHNAAVAREADAIARRQQAILADQERQYMRMLPYMLEARRQDLNRQSNLERNEILNRALNGTSYVPAVGLRPGPVDNGNRMPLP